MLFASTIKKVKLHMILVSLLSDFVMITIPSYFIFGNHVMPGIYIWAALEVISFILGIASYFARLAYYCYFVKKEFISSLFHSLIEHKFPIPDEYELSTFDYLCTIMANKKINPETRVKAAFEAGNMQYISSKEYFLIRGLEKALIKYRNYCIEKGVTENNNANK